MRLFKSLTLLTALLIAVASLSACGAKGDLEPPPKKESSD